METAKRPATHLRLVPADAPSDEALVLRARSGDQTAGGMIYERHARDVRRLLVRVLGPDAGLPDLLQEIFMEALAGLGGLTQPARLRAWLLRIAVFRARNLLRSRRRSRWIRLFGADEELDPPAQAASPELRDDLARAWRALGKLDPDERIVLCLRRIDGMDLAEIAQACDVSLATVKRRLARAQTAFAALCRADESLRYFVTDRSEGGHDDAGR